MRLAAVLERKAKIGYLVLAAVSSAAVLAMLGDLLLRQPTTEASLQAPPPAGGAPAVSYAPSFDFSGPRLHSDYTDDTTWAAFEAAWGVEPPAVIERDDAQVEFLPAAIEGSGPLIQVGKQRVLVSAGSLAQPSHIGVGAYVIDYLDRPKTEPVRRYLGRGASWGQAPLLRLDRSVMDHPVLFAEGSYTRADCSGQWLGVVELRPEGPVAVEIYTGGEFDPTIEGRESSAPAWSLASRLTPTSYGFQVQYSGSDRRLLRYRRQGDKFVTTDSIKGLPMCADTSPF